VLGLIHQSRTQQQVLRLRQPILQVRSMQLRCAENDVVKMV